MNHKVGDVVCAKYGNFNGEKEISKITMRAGLIGSVENKIVNLDINIMAVEDKINELIDEINNLKENDENMKKAMINYIQSEKFDDLYTPSYAIKPLLKYIHKGITLWECCDFCRSEITRLLKEHGCEVISTDKEENFFEYIPNKHFDMIITNPPYSLKDDFIKKCYKWTKPFCLLLPITALEVKTR